MNIPILNIYYLLCYAWNKLDEKETVNVQATGATELADLFAKILINGTIYLFKKGLDRDYITIEEEARQIKGKLLFGPSLKKNLFQQAKAACQYDELSYNILHNQILKTTISHLLRTKDLDKENIKDLISIYRRFPAEVEEREIQVRDFHSVRLHRNNCFYDFLMKICEIIHNNILIDEQTGKYKFMDFLQDEGRMRILFEEFVRNFYKREQNAFKVKRENIEWKREQIGEFDKFLPIMQTDISLEHKDKSRKIIIDTKFSLKALQSKHEGSQKKVKSENLYQLYSYLKNTENKPEEMNKNCEGILLYPVVEDNVDYSFALPGHKVRVKTINLDQHWQKIHNELLELIQ